jgi:glycosyltransferase involved in cell wall biosynthesis
MEFMSVGVPVIVANTKIDRYYFDDTVVRFFESGNPEALARELSEMLRNPALREKMAIAALDYATQNCWDTRKVEYMALIDDLMQPRQP